MLRVSIKALVCKLPLTNFGCMYMSHGFQEFRYWENVLRTRKCKMSFESRQNMQLTSENHGQKFWKFLYEYWPLAAYVSAQPYPTIHKLHTSTINGRDTIWLHLTTLLGAKSKSEKRARLPLRQGRKRSVFLDPFKCKYRYQYQYQILRLQSFSISIGIEF